MAPVIPPARPPGAVPVLILDPDRPWAEAVCGALRERSFAPAAAATPEEARRRLGEQRFGLLVISSSAGAGAVEFLLHLARQRGAPPPILLIEDHRDGGPSEAWRFLRAARTLRRPCRVRDVADAVTALAGRTGMERGAMA